MNQNSTVRKIDIAKVLSCSKPNVTYAIRRLEKEGFVVEKNGCILLTESGKEIAECLHEKNNVLTKIFESLGDDREDAIENARRIEMIISDKLFLLLKEMLETENNDFSTAAI